MKLASFEWRTAALPAVVLTLAAGAFLWFNYVQRPGVEQYLHQAKLRLLRTMGAQLESRIDGIEGNIELALKAFRQTKTKANSGGASSDQERFASFVRMYAADLVIDCLTPATDASGESSCAGAADTVLKEAAKPPVAMWLRGSGRARLYLGYRSDDSSVVANIDLQALFADNLPTESEFDALLLADSAGRVIVQHSAEGLALASASQLPIDQGSPATPEDKGQDAERGFVRLQSARPDTRVLVGGRSYHLYVQPLSLSVKHLESQGEPNRMEGWTLCGLVAVDRIRNASGAVSYDTLIWFGAIFIAVGASVPLLKLRLLRSHERLTRVDAALVGASIFVEVALVSFVMLDFLQFGVIVPRLVEDELASVAETVIEEFASEAKQIDTQMETYHLQLQHELAGKTFGGTPKINVGERAVTCEPAWACRAALKEEPPGNIEQMPYPFFDLVNWIDRAGTQQVKFASAASVTPFINLNDQRVAWSQSLSEALRLGPDVAQQSGVSVLVSPTTGKRLTVFWKARPQAPTGEAFAQLVGQSLATNPLSLDQPVLPADTTLAVVDPDGLVLFHSDRTRSMKENFIQESEDNLRLRTLVEHGRDGVLEVKYRARDQLLFVRSLKSALGESASAGKLPFEPPDWSLIVFQEHSVPDTLNLYTLATAGFLFIGYSSVLLLAFGVATLLLKKRAIAWLWPDRRQALAYWAVAAVNGSIALICVFAIYGQTPPRALALTGAGVVLSLASSVFVPAWSRPRRTDERARGKLHLRSRWLPAFVSAHSSLILTLAVVPAMATMHTAATIEQRMFMERDAQRRLDGVRARFQRLQARIPVKGLCQDSEGVPTCDLKVAAYVGRLRTANERGRLASPLFPDQDTISVGATTGGAAKTDTWSLPQMEWFLKHAHPPVNDLGVGLAALVSETAPREAQPSVWWLLVLPGVGLLAVWLVRDVTDRLCLPALNAAPGPVPGEIAITAVNRLVLTLPWTDTAREWRNLKARHVDGRLQPLTWPANETPTEVVVVHHLQVVLADRAARERLLSQLEAAVYQERQPVWLVCDREPVRYLAATLLEGAGGDPTAQAGRNEVNRWIALLQSFQCEISNAAVPPRRPEAPSAAFDPLAQEAAGCAALEPLTDDIRRRLAGTGFTDADRWLALEEAAEPYYRSLWTSCSIEERLVLRQLAEEGLVNPRDRDVLLSLMRKRLVVRDPAFRLMNESFARFVKRAVPARTISEWERQVAGTPWSSVRTAVFTFALAGAGFVLFTQQQFVSAWVGMLPALVPALLFPMAREAVGKLLAQGFTSKEASAGNG